MKRLPPLERVHRPSIEHFRSEYLSKSRPVIITGLTDEWQDVSSISPAGLRAAYGDLVGNVRETDDEFEFFFGAHGGRTRDLTLREYVDLITTRTSDPRPPYFGNISLSKPPLPALAELGDRFRFPPFFPNTTDETRLWVGAAGQRSTIHNDPYGNFNAQVHGRKAFLLLHPRHHFNLYAQKLHDGLWASPIDPDRPDLGKYPLFNEAEAYDVVLDEGDTLFIPIFWWHQARAITVSVNVNNWFSAVGGLWSPLRAQRQR